MTHATGWHHLNRCYLMKVLPMCVCCAAQLVGRMRVVCVHILAATHSVHSMGAALASWLAWLGNVYGNGAGEGGGLLLGLADEVLYKLQIARDGGVPRDTMCYYMTPPLSTTPVVFVSDALFQLCTLGIRLLQSPACPQKQSVRAQHLLLQPAAC